MADKHYKIAIIGSGPAGFTAGIYAARANLKPVIFEGMQPGGQLTITTDIENFPGFDEGISGPVLMDVMRKQAHRFGAESIYKQIDKVDFSSKPFKLKAGDDEFSADSVIVATGASAKYLGLDSEESYKGFGVSACATCDGFFYRGLKVLVVGGGDTAMEEAEYLTKFAETVTIIHRREEFRASKVMIDRVKKNPKIKFELNQTIKEVLGKTEDGKKFVTGATLENLIDGSTKEISADGIFIAIGHTPNTQIFKGLLDMDETGYLIAKEDGSTYTNIEGVFAAGDVADHVYRQAVTAAGTGCKAAIDAERWLFENDLA